MNSIIKEFDDNLVNHRLTIDKTNKYKVRNPIFNEPASNIDFKNYVEGGRYVVPLKWMIVILNALLVVGSLNI